MTVQPRWLPWSALVQLVAAGSVLESQQDVACFQPQTSLYYSLQVMGDTQDKSDVYAAIKEDVDEYLADILNEELTCDCQE